MKRIVAFVILICIIALSLPSAYASESAGLEFYALAAVADGYLITGRYYNRANCEISLELVKQGDSSAVPITVQTISDGDGVFVLTVDAEEAVYNMKVSAEEGCFESTVDFSGLQELLSMTEECGYKINSVAYTSSVIKISGTHGGTPGSRVSLKATAADDKSDIKGMAQAKSDESCNFVIEFLVSPGDYVLSFKTEGVDIAECAFSYKAMDYIERLDAEIDLTSLLEKCALYISGLEELIAECAEKNISTDYEEVNLEIIKKFTEYIPNEAAHEDLSRISQYNYALTRIYNETRQKLESYLNGEKEPFKATNYITSDIKTDGRSVVAKTVTDGAEKEQPVFFTGYGFFDTAAEEIPFFSEIGINSIQYCVYLDEVFVEIPEWERKNKNRWIDFGITDEFHASGEHSLEISATEGYEMNYYCALMQTVEVKPKTTYNYGLKAKGSGLIEENPESACIYLPGSANRIRKNLRNSQDFENYDFEYTTGEDETELTVWLLVENDIESLYIDDVYVKEVNSDINLIANGDFEAGFENITDYDSEARELGFYINHASLEKLESILKAAEDNNVLVDIIFGLEKMPEFILKSEDDLTHGDGFLPFTINHPKIKKILSLYGRLLASVASKYKSCQTMCMTNEPSVFSCNHEYYIPYWHEYLKELYNDDINKLNDTYQNNGKYKSFDEVEMPAYITRTPVYNDYRNFNDKIMSEFHIDLYNDIKSEYPDMKLHTKTLQYFRYWNYQNYYARGTNYELVGDVLDINGCDASTPYEDSEGHPTSIKMAWYDMLTSVADKPVFDTENHTLADYTEPVYSDLIANHTAADVWMGAIHGRAMTNLWYWDLQDKNMPWGNSKHSNSNMVLRSLTVAEVSETALDLNRLSEEITALQKAKANVGILYSRINVGYSQTGYTDSSIHYMKACGEAYEQTIFNGQKARFILDSEPQSMNECKLLIVPNVTNVKEDMLKAVMEYLDSGGKVLISGENSLKYDEYNNPHDTELTEYIFNHENSDTTSMVEEAVREIGLSEIVLSCTDGSKPDKTEWSYTEYKDGVLVNIMNYGESAQSLSLSYRGRVQRNMTELRSGTASDTIVLEPLKPQLIYFSTNTFDMLDENNILTEENITVLKSGRIRYNTAADGRVILALYKNDMLIDVSTDKDVMDVEIPDDGNRYMLKAFVWDINKYSPSAGIKSIKNDI